LIEDAIGRVAVELGAIDERPNLSFGRAHAMQFVGTAAVEE
jgi:hypothetical protein